MKEIKPPKDLRYKVMNFQFGSPNLEDNALKIRTKESLPGHKLIFWTDWNIN